MKSKLKKIKNPGLLQIRRQSLLMVSAMILLLSVPSIMKAQLSGTYTICSSGCNYSSFGAAVSDLNSNGVNGAVIFNVSSGTYNGSVNISAITGASATNTITFQGAGRGNSIISSSGTSLTLSNAKFVSFKGFTISGSSYSVYSYFTVNCSISDCDLNSSSTGSYNIYDYFTRNWTMNNCHIKGGYYAIFVYSSPGSSTYSKNMYSNNRITGFGYYGIWTYYTNQASYIGNVIDSSANGYGNGIESLYESGCTYTGNQIIAPGLYNPIVMELENYYSSTYPCLITNNYMSNYIDYAYFITEFASNVKIAHNTFDGNNSYYAAYIFDYQCPGGIYIVNNMFLGGSNSNSAAYYYAYGNLSSAFVMFDGNDYINTGGGPVVSFNGTTYSTLSAYQAFMSSYSYTNPFNSVVSAFESHATNTAPTFLYANKADLDPSGNIPHGVYAGINTDIYGTTRSTSSPVAGAFEGNPCTLTSAIITAGGPTTFCAGGSVVLSANTANTYSWSNQNGPILGANGNTYTATSSGTYYVTLSNGANCNVTSAGMSVTVNPVPVAGASASPTTVFYGYTTAYNTSVLSGSSDIFGSSYSWTSNPSGYTSASAGGSVTPSATTTYYLDVTSPEGCTSTTASVTVNVIDVRCGNNNDKVLICHNCNSLCIASNAVAAHLANHAGDQLGTCGACKSKPEEEFENQVGIYPNPFSNSTNLRMVFVKDQQIAVELYSVDGKLIRPVFTGSVSAHSAYNFEIDGSSLTPGVYLVKINTGDNVDFRKIEIIR